MEVMCIYRVFVVFLVYSGGVFVVLRADVKWLVVQWRTDNVSFCNCYLS